MKKVFWGIGIVLLSPILIFIILTILLYLPPVQNWAVQKAASYASEATGMDISVGRIALKFPLDLRVDDVCVVQNRDTIAEVGQIVADVQLMPLFSSKVVVDAFEFNRTKINTADMIAAAKVRGSVESLSMKSRGINLSEQAVELNGARLEGAWLDVQLNDTITPEDTTTSATTLWKIMADSLVIARTELTLHMPGDTMSVKAYLGKATVGDALIDLGTQRYAVDRFRLNDGTLAYDNNYEPQTEGLDYNHIALGGINIAVDSILYQAPLLKLNVKDFRMKEKSGLEIAKLTCPVTMDSLRLLLPDIYLRTPHSKITAGVVLDLDFMDDHKPGKVDATLLASIGKQDIMAFCQSMPQAFIARYPDWPLSVDGKVAGNLKRMDVERFEIALPTAFAIDADGYAENVTDMKRLLANLDVKAKTYNLDFAALLAGMDGKSGFVIPQGIMLDGNIGANGMNYEANLIARQDSGTVRLEGMFDMNSQTYQAMLGIDRLNLHNFIPNDSLYHFSAEMGIDGRGFDVFSKNTRMAACAEITQFVYGEWNLNEVKADAKVVDGRAQINLVSHNQLADGSLNLDALLDKSKIDATLSTDLHKADFYRLRMVEKPLTTSICAHIDVASDLDQYHKLEGSLSDITIRAEKKTYRPTDITIDMLTRIDTTWAKLNSGNLALDLKASGGYKTLIEQITALGDEISLQLEQKVINQPKLRELLPTVKMHLFCGNDNPFAGMLRAKGLEFDDLTLNVNTSPAKGLNGDGHLYSLFSDSLQLDTVAFRIFQKESNIYFNGQVRNNKRNPQFVFNALFDGILLERGAEMGLRYFDQNDELGVMIAAATEVVDSGLSIRLRPKQPILGYKAFALNDDNFIFLGADKKIKAKIDLIAADGTGVKIYSEEQDTTLLQDITVSLNRFDLDKITAVIPYSPRVTGLLNGDFRILQDADQNLQLLSDLAVHDMTYEKSPVGDLSSEFVYLLKDENTHIVDARIFHEGNEIGVLSGSYLTEGKGYLDAMFDIVRMPMYTVNGLVPDQLFTMSGYADGRVAIKGPLDKFIVDGEMKLDSSDLVSEPYGVRLRFDKTPIRVSQSNLVFDNFTMYGNNNNPLAVNGNINFANLDAITMKMNMRAQDYLLVDSKQTRRSIAYGKAFVNFFASLSGHIDNLRMMGKLDVLGKTDVTYILKDSPLNTDDQLKDLVTFTDFKDTAQVVVERPPLNGLNMTMMLNVEPGARIMCALNADQSNYVNLEGGGELRMVYNPMDDLQLFGRYTLNQGEMKYELPIIPLKTFKIQEGSYIEFTGDILNPRLNLTATEEVKALVAAETGNSRSVLFNCGVKVSNTLSKMGLEFTLDAPDDMTVKNELAAMSLEQRGKLAVTMLTTGMYLADGNTSGFSMNNALNSFLQSEINNITKSALRTVDLSLGLDQSADGTGNTHTDYSFKFAKRFWNNRINFVIGGKFSSGNDTPSGNQDDTFIDNVSLEYRLDQTAMRYVRLFYNKEADDLLEDRISEYGAGFVWRKKMDALSDLFKSNNQTLLRTTPKATAEGEKKEK